MEEKAVANGAAVADVAAPENKDAASKEEAGKSKNAEEQNKGTENGAEGPSDGDVKMEEAETAKEGDADVDAAKQVVSEDVKMDADAKEGTNAKTEESEDVKMTEAEAGNTEVKDKEQNEDKLESANVDKLDESREEEKDGSAEHEEKKGKEISAAEKEVEEEAEGMGAAEKEAEETGAAEKEEEKEAEETGAAEKEEEMEAEETGAADKEDEEEAEETGAAEKEDEEEAEETGAAEKEDEEEAEEKGSSHKEDESDKKVEENKETPKNKKARSARDRSQGKDNKKDGSRSREAKSLLDTPSPYGTDRPQRERKTVERLVEVIEKEPNKNFVVEKGRGTPLKDMPTVAHRISRRKPTDLKFLHSVLFGRKGKIVDFKGHILQFSGFVWHESDEKQRAKAKEKLDKCVKDMLLDLCWLLAIPVPKANIRKEDIVSKLLDFIAEPHSAAESGLSDDQGSNSRKRKRGGGSANKTPEGKPNRSGKKFGDDTTSGKRLKQAIEFSDSEDDFSLESDSMDHKDEDATQQEDDHDSRKEKANKKSLEVKGSSGKKKADTGNSHKTGPPKTMSKSPIKKSSKIYKEKESPDDSAKVFSRKRKPTSKGEKDIKEKKSSGKKVTKVKGESGEAELPSKDDLRKTIIEILKKVDFNTATFSDILKKLDNHYKMDLTPSKESIKVLIQDELTKLSEEADEDEDESEDAEKKQQQPQAKEIEA